MNVKGWAGALLRPVCPCHPERGATLSLSKGERRAEGPLERVRYDAPQGILTMNRKFLDLLS